jgi:proprotein convertase subtilisin/kexin type 5
VACATCTTPVNSAITCGSCKTAGFIRTSPATACFSCFSGCLTCTSTAGNACLTCLYGYFYDSVNQACALSCPLGTYGDEISSSCLPCSTPCVSCLGFNGGSYYCQSCIANYYLYSFSCYTSCPYSLIGYQGNCVSSCPSGTYADSITTTCLNCIASCSECTNGTACFICNNGTFMYNGICYINCPVNYYGNNQTQLCLACHSSCLTCNGPFSDNCISCPGTILISNICYTTCPSNTYSGSCLPCDTSCLTCSGSAATNCLTCASPLFFHVNLTECISSCNVGEISNNYNFTCTQCPFGMVAYFETCQSCSSTCLNCNGITFLDCTSCNAGTSLVQKTCVLASESNVIYMPNKTNSNSIKNAFMTIFFIQFFLCLLLEGLFQYKTNILLTIELLQILSYTQFLTIELS